MVQIGDTINFDDGTIPYINCVRDAHKMFQSTMPNSRQGQNKCDICGGNWDDQCYSQKMI
jgi:hypothetical protein